MKLLDILFGLPAFFSVFIIHSLMRYFNAVRSDDEVEAEYYSFLVDIFCILALLSILAFMSLAR